MYRYGVTDHGLDFFFQFLFSFLSCRFWSSSLFANSGLALVFLCCNFILTCHFIVGMSAVDKRLY